LNEFYDTLRRANNDIDLDEVLFSIKIPAVNHFATEEKYFDEFSYEHTEEHKAAHKDLLNKVGEFVSNNII